MLFRAGRECPGSAAPAGSIPASAPVHHLATCQNINTYRDRRQEKVLAVSRYVERSLEGIGKDMPRSGRSSIILPTQVLPWKKGRCGMMTHACKRHGTATLFT